MKLYGSINDFIQDENQIKTRISMTDICSQVYGLNSIDGNKKAEQIIKKIDQKNQTK